MAAQNRDVLNEQTCVIILDFLSSSFSSDEDEYFRNLRRIVPKMKNFLQTVHQYSDYDVSLLL